MKISKQELVGWFIGLVGLVWIGYGIWCVLSLTSFMLALTSLVLGGSLVSIGVLYGTK